MPHYSFGARIAPSDLPRVFSFADHFSLIKGMEILPTESVRLFSCAVPHLKNNICTYICEVRESLLLVVIVLWVLVGQYSSCLIVECH